MTIFKGHRHCEAAHRYAISVVLGEVVAPEEIKQACQRQLDDLERTDFPYVFDVTLAEKVCNFIELLPHTKGRWRGQRIKLEPWQQFALTTMFGWVDLPGPATAEYPEGYKGGFRRFSEAYISVARKNGKSILAAGIGLYLFCETNGDEGPEIYSGATTQKQAMEVFKPARLMCKMTPDLCAKYDIEVNAQNLAQPESGGKFEPIIGNPGDGGSPSCAIIDEYHEHNNSDQVDTMITGMAAREEPLLLIITTAGTDTASPCYDKHLDAKKMLDKTVDVNEKLFALIYGLDPDDDYTDDAVWIKANPNLGVSVATKYIIARVSDAVRNSSNENKVKIKNFNQWVNAKSAWLNTHQWSACGDDTLYEGDFANDECIGALDMSNRLDLTAFIRLYIREVEGRKHYYAFGSHFLPEDSINKPENDAYLKWYKDGDLLEAGELEIDHDIITQYIEDFYKGCNMREVTYDPWKAQQIAQSLEKKGAVVVEFKQQVKEMTQAMKEMEGAIIAGRFHHDDDPVLNWQSGNVINKIDKKGNYYPDKERGHLKIDGIVCVIMAIGRAMFELEVDEESVYNTRGVRQL